MAAPEYGARQVKFGIEDKDVLKDISKKDNVIFVDVRNPNEISESPSACSGFVAGKFLLEEDCAPDDVSKELPNKDAHHIVFCAIGGRASTACQKLREFGYSNVYNAGGVGDLDLFLD